MCFSPRPGIEHGRDSSRPPPSEPVCHRRVAVSLDSFRGSGHQALTSVKPVDDIPCPGHSVGQGWTVHPTQVEPVGAQVTQGQVNGTLKPWESRPSVVEVLVVLVAVAAVNPTQTRGAGGDCGFWLTSTGPIETCCPRVVIPSTPFRSLKHRFGQ